MIDWTTELGQRARARLEAEALMWLTTVDAHGVPQPRPIWFVWREPDLYFFSMPGAAKLRHVARSPQVALNFEAGPEGEDVQVLLGTAEIMAQPDPTILPLYLDKYRALIPGTGLTEEQIVREFSTLIHFTLVRLR